MFYLTPQERKFIALIIVIFTLGACIQLGLHRDIPPMRWAKAVRHFKININTAAQEQFQMLPGIGAKLSQRIVDYRRVHGSFSKLDDLCKVKGFRVSRLAKIKGLITL